MIRPVLQRLTTTGILLAIFMLGWFAANVYTTASRGTVENPLDYHNLLRGNVEEASPKDRIGEDKIKVYPDHIQLDLAGASWSTFADTNSMDPVFDKGANGIEIHPASSDDLIVGDVISFKIPSGDLVVHRIIRIGEDADGWYAKTRGDNNSIDDPYTVRFGDIHGVLVGVIY